MWTIVCALFGLCGGLEGSPLGRVRSFRSCGVDPSAASRRPCVPGFVRVVHGVIRRLTRVLSCVVRAVSCPCSFSRALRDFLDAALRRYNTTFPPRLRGSSSSGCVFSPSCRLYGACGLLGTLGTLAFGSCGCGRVVARQTSCGPCLLPLRFWLSAC